MSHKLTHPDAHIPPDLIGINQSVSPERFEQLCRQYSELRLELTSTGELIVMPPSSLESGGRNSNLTRNMESK
jgi:Uma2 family endonuclease